MTTEMMSHGVPVSACCICGVNPRILGAVLCKECKAEIVLTEGASGLKAVEALHERPANVSVAIGNPGASSSAPPLAKAIRCGSCGKTSVYNPMNKKAAYFCDECNIELCPACAAYCNHKDFNYQAKVLCKNCRAEKSLTGQPVDEVEGSLPGQETEPKRIPKPHCGRATCIEDPAHAGESKCHSECTHPPDQYPHHKAFCECRCMKCVEAIASGFVEPQFGKMTPDPEPEPEKDDVDEDLDDEQDALAREAGQA